MSEAGLDTRENLIQCYTSEFYIAHPKFPVFKIRCKKRIQLFLNKNIIRRQPITLETISSYTNNLKLMCRVTQTLYWRTRQGSHLHFPARRQGVLVRRLEHILAFGEGIQPSHSCCINKLLQPVLHLNYRI